MKLRGQAPFLTCELVQVDGLDNMQSTSFSLMLRNEINVKVEPMNNLVNSKTLDSKLEA